MARLEGRGSARGTLMRVKKRPLGKRTLRCADLEVQNARTNKGKEHGKGRLATADAGVTFERWVAA